MSLSESLSKLINHYPGFMHKSLSLTSAALIEYFETNQQVFRSNQFSDFLPGNDQFIEALVRAWSRSDFLRESSLRLPHVIVEWAGEASPLYRKQADLYYQQSLRQEVKALDDEAGLMKVLRELRRKEMMRLVARDLLKLASLEETLGDVTALADASVEVALEYLYVQMCAKYGRPFSRAKGDQLAEQQYMLVLAMGKHGARELNVSSDIDLIFAFPQSGETDHPTKPIENQLFFVRLGQKLIHVLDAVNADGFVFRVDMRLRPYGDSGALALNFAAFEDYYYTQGREWERYAMIKARIINQAAHPDISEKFMSLIRPFVYRKYADFTSIQALRDMKRLIMSEVHRKGGDQNIKLGRGGIREVEFIAQACQLIYGGRETDLQLTGLMSVYQALRDKHLLPAEWVDKLIESYRFLRNLEHAIQGLADKQTQQIPALLEEQERVAWSMGFASWQDLLPVLNGYRDQVNQCFEDFLSEPEAEAPKTQVGLHQDILHLWRTGADRARWLALFEKLGFDECERSIDELLALKQNRLFMLMSAIARQRFEQFLPAFLVSVSEAKSPSKTLLRMLGLIKTIMGRSVYFVLLYENVSALKRLCDLCAKSPWVAEHIAKSPVILDELLDPQSLFKPPQKAELEDELRQQLLRIPEDDLEAQMNCLRTFKQSHMLRVAAAELGGHLPLMKVSDYLTWLAETILAQALAIAWQNMVKRHGLPSGKDNCAEQDDISAAKFVSQGFAIVGYGKLGGIELGYSSDLDMVFLYDADDYGMTLGERSINNQMFYIRLGQKVIHILSAQSTQGILYDTDMRLRPSGNSGMLVSSIAAFERYQRNDAWTWEHQALVRARALVGDGSLIEKFNLIRQSILAQKRDYQALKLEVKGMREKMKANAKVLTIKQADGGLIDIEFISQFAVLAYAHEYSELTRWTDNIRILETLNKERCLGKVDLSQLEEIYRRLRSAMHHNSLADEQDTIPVDALTAEMAQVSEVWHALFD